MVTAQDIMTFTKRFEFDDAWIFHCIAINRRGKRLFYSGPCADIKNHVETVEPRP